MSKKPNPDTVLGVFCSDVHWQEQPPIARAGESDWLATQEQYMLDIANLCERFACPLFIVGDLFTRWNSSPHIIAWAVRILSLYRSKSIKVYAIPGNHDTPNHNLLELHRSAYWVLVEAGLIGHIVPGATWEISAGYGNLLVNSFFPNSKITPPDKTHSLCLNVALIHSFIWTAKTGHPGADESTRYGAWHKKLKGYDAAFFGDNHQGFLIPSKKKGYPTIMNCGTLLRRAIDEKDYKPRVGLLHLSGEVSQTYLNTKEDVFIDSEKDLEKLAKSLDIDFSGFAEELSRLRSERKDFVRILCAWAERPEVPDTIRTLLLKAVGRGK